MCDRRIFGRSRRLQGCDHMSGQNHRWHDNRRTGTDRHREQAGRYRRREAILSQVGHSLRQAGVSYRVGREDNSEYGETWNGSELLDLHQFPDGIDPFVEPGNPESGLLWGISDAKEKDKGTGDNRVQAYNYRICLTDQPDNMIPIGKPERYDPEKGRVCQSAGSCVPLRIPHRLRFH